MPIGDPYVCEVCHQPQVKGRSDEDAAAEARRLWGDLPDSEMGLVCDDCFHQVMYWLETGER